MVRAAHAARCACCPCSVIQQLRARGAYLIVVCNEGDTDVEEICQGHASLVKVPLVSHLPTKQMLGEVCASKRPGGAVPRLNTSAAGTSCSAGDKWVCEL